MMFTVRYCSSDGLIKDFKPGISINLGFNNRRLTEGTCSRGLKAGDARPTLEERKHGILMRNKKKRKGGRAMPER